MSFQPLLPLPGYAGWRYLNRSMDQQLSLFAASPVLKRDMDYFRAEIGKITSAADLVKDYRLLRVSLAAFGLQDDLPNRAFITRILSDGVSNPEALANKLADKRYRAFAESFGFGSTLPPRTQSAGFAAEVLSKFQRQEFERAVGAQDETMRLALTALRELPDIIAEDLSENGLWFRVMGNPPLRSVFETALGLPSSIGKLDLDLQVGNFKSRAKAVFGDASLKQFSNPDRQEDLIRNFMTRAQLAAQPAALSPMSIALTLLGGVR